VQQTQINFVDMPNAVQSEIAVVNTVNLKLLTNNILLLFWLTKFLGGGGEKEDYFKLT
jgi:hypothetical protein